MKQTDLDLIKEFLREQKIDPLNTRAFKKPDGTYEVTIGSIDKSERELTFKEHKFRVCTGEFAPYLEECNYYLDKAKQYAANDTQKEMLELYIEHFKTGSVELHKDS